MITPYRPDDIPPFYPAVVDIETASDGRVLAIEYGYQDEHNVRVFATFSNWGDFIVFIRRLVGKYKGNRAQLHRITRIWAHNGANFDYLSLVEFLRDNRLASDTQYILSGSTGIGVVIKLHSKETLRLYDSNRLLPGSLDKLCKEFNTETKKLDVDKKYKSKMELFLKKYPKLFYDYLHADVCSLQEVIYKFWCMLYAIEGSVGYLPMTLPSMALRLFRINMDDSFVISVPWNKEVKEFSRRAYTGGRVECYRSGKHEHVNIYDVNSMYPSVMQANVYPSSARAAWTQTYRTDLLGLWEIEYEQSNTLVPPVLRDEMSGDFSYTGKGVYTTPEIELIKEIGIKKLTITKGVVFQRSTKLFEKFVDKYYGLRLQAQREGNSALAYVCKILLNSLYGKFGQVGVKQQIVQVTKEKIAEVMSKGGSVHIISDDYMVTLENDMVEHEFVAIAAYVTSYARVVLYRAILAAGSGYIYSDTDSVHIDESSNTKPNNIGDNLGEMKLEYTGEVIYLGKKLYHPKDGKPKAKGIGRAIKNGTIDYDTFNSLLDTNKELQITFDVFPTVKEVMSGKQQACVMFQRTRTLRRLN